ncbi:VOC family protein [Paracoccus salsus]|uniref:VOC family protein n=1 Tax=Paracoccus salsus TaxID=2911061 RepID=UPI001F2BBE56|nr:VOC family protein [Paracoccus salsus]MCF3972165.1 VOC family protein [Paracoccus salsus]
MIATIPHFILPGAVADAVALWSRAFPDMTVEPSDDGDPPACLRVIVAGQPVILCDGPPVQPVGFDPSDSLLISCERASDVDRIARILARDGLVFMPPGDYPFARRYTWFADRFGVNWQVMLSTGKEP